MTLQINNWTTGQLVTPTDMQLLTNQMLDLQAGYSNGNPTFYGFNLSITGGSISSTGGLVYFGTTSDISYITNSGTNQVFCPINAQSNIPIVNSGGCYIVATYTIASAGRVSTLSATISTSLVIPTQGIIIGMYNSNNTITSNAVTNTSSIENYFKRSTYLQDNNYALQVVNPLNNALTTFIALTQVTNINNSTVATTAFVQQVALPMVGTTINSYQQVTSYSQGVGRWFLCNGQAISRTQYPQLFALLGISQGAGDGVNTFNLPNEQGKVTAMCSTTHNFGTSTGSDTVAVVLPQHQHTMNGYNTHIHGDDHKHNDLGHAHETGPTRGTSGTNDHTAITSGNSGNTIGTNFANISYKSQVAGQTVNTGPVSNAGTNTTDLTGTANASISVVQPTIYKNVYIFAL